MPTCPGPWCRSSSRGPRLRAGVAGRGRRRGRDRLQRRHRRGELTWTSTWPPCGPSSASATSRSTCSSPRSSRPSLSPTSAPTGTYRHARVELDRKTGHVVIWAREELEIPPPSAEDDDEATRRGPDASRPRVRRHPHRLRPDRRRHRPAGHRAAPARHRGRGDPRRLQGPRGRHRRRHHPAEPGPAARDRRLRHGRGHPPARRAGARARSTCTASGCAASSSRSRVARKGPQIGLSRTHPNLVRKLFALEVPEIADGSVEIAALAREAGHRTKIAVHSKVPGPQRQGLLHRPDGGPRARRHERAARREDRHRRLVRGPRRPSSPPRCRPARVSSVEIVDRQLRSARVIVPDYQLSLAIGREGQNARLAAKLTGWRIDIRPDTDGGPSEGARPASALRMTPVPHAAAVGGRLVGTDRTGLRPRTIPTTSSEGRAARLGRVSGVGGRIAGRHSCEWSAEPGADGIPVVLPDPRRRRPGRGAWLHPAISCLDHAVRRRAFGRALRSSAPPDHCSGRGTGSGPSEQEPTVREQEPKAGLTLMSTR